MSSRRKRSPEEQARREKLRELLQSSGVSSMEDIQNLFKETIAEFMENGLDAELDTELGYSRYDYKNKETDDSRNGFLRWSRARSRIFSSSTFILCTPSPGLFLPHTVDKYSTERMETKEAALRRLRHSSTYDIDMTIGTFEG